MRIVEYDDDFNNFIDEYSKSNVLLIPIYKNENHVQLRSDLVLLYVYIIDHDKEYVIPFSHSEAINQSLDRLDKLKTPGEVWCVNKKRFSHIFQEQMNDVDLMSYMMINRKLDKSDSRTAAHIFFQRGKQVTNIGHIIPITKHVEYCSNIRNKFLSFYDVFEIDDAYECYNHILDILGQIEKPGLSVDTESWRRFYRVSPRDNKVWGEYNLYTQTGRPSNSKDGVNFAGFPKANGSRKCIQSRHGKDGFLIQFDYDAYHLRLIGDLIDYKFPDNINVHEYLGKHYFGTETLTPQMYEKSKAISFKQMYGRVDHQYKDIPFYSEVTRFIDELWTRMKKYQYIETPVYKRKLLKAFYEDMTRSKLFNYLLQAYETERNMEVLSRILPLYENIESKIVLYTYDSILIDFNVNDGADIVHRTKYLLEAGGFPTKVTVGPNYHEMKEKKL